GWACAAGGGHGYSGRRGRSLAAARTGCGPRQSRGVEWNRKTEKTDNRSRRPERRKGRCAGEEAPETRPARPQRQTFRRDDFEGECGASDAAQPPQGLVTLRLTLPFSGG